MPDIKLQGVVKRFGKVTALKGIDLDIKDGEFFVIVGPTGAGKTTTLRIVAGLEKVDSGKVFFGEVDASRIPTAERDVAFIFQSFSLYPQMTVRENLAFPLRSPLYRESKEKIEKSVANVAKLLHISHLLDRLPHALSGGEMQRVGIGRAIVRKPRFFLMDEPLSDLDAKLREELRVELRQIQQNLKTTTLYVTHDQIEAMSMGDRVAVLNEGQVHQVGSPKEVYSRPQDIFVARFIGRPRINLFECKISEDEKSYLLLEKELIRIPVSDMLDKKVANFNQKRNLILGIRPEAVLIHKEKGPRRFESEILFLEHFGSMNIINLKIGEKIFKSRTHPSMILRPREKVWVELEENHMLFFDSISGKAIEV